MDWHRKVNPVIWYAGKVKRKFSESKTMNLW
jgi:hypothetical protein